MKKRLLLLLFSFVLLIKPALADCEQFDFCPELRDYCQKHLFALEDESSLSPLIKAAGNKKAVLLGEASHGTSEYYLWRQKISRRLIEEKGFSFILIEGDWPASFALNLYVKGKVSQEIGAFLRQNYQRWPRWMWANQEVAGFIEWLREYNLGLPPKKRVGFYGMDVYSLQESAELVQDFLAGLKEDQAVELSRNYDCFAVFDYDGFAYGKAAAQRGFSCREKSAEVLEFFKQDPFGLAEKDPYLFWNLKINALVVKNAERYYRLAVLGRGGWNSRVYHMKDVFAKVFQFYSKEAKGIVWAHNTHIGDARATAMEQRGQVNIGQLARQDLGPENVFNVGFGSYEGEVVAGRNWGFPFEVVPVPPAKRGSLEWALSFVEEDKFFLIFDQADKVKEILGRPYGHRAIGVVYDPVKEHLGNYVPTVLPNRYDAFLFFQKTQGLSPLGKE